MEKDYNLVIRGNVQNTRGTIHPTAISRGFSLPLDPTRTVIKFKDIEMHLPESRDAIAQARKLLDMFEETLPKPQKHQPEKSIVSAPPDGSVPEYDFHECEKFNISNLPAHKVGKTTYWLAEIDSQKRICFEREGYAKGLYVYVVIDDLKYLYDHPDEVIHILKKFIKHKKYHVTGFLRDVDISLLTGQTEPEEPEEQPSEQSEQHNEHSESNGDPKSKPKIEFFHEDAGFDYMAVQPKWVGKAQVYTNLNNGKMVIKSNREIVLTTKDTIEKFLKYDEKDLTASIRGINSQKQNILRVYLTELKRREVVEA